MKFVVKFCVILLVLPVIVMAGKEKEMLKNFAVETEKFQHQIHQQIRNVKNSFSNDTSRELVQMWLSVDETLADMENLKMGIRRMMEDSEAKCVDECPTKYDVAIDVANVGYQECLRRTHNTSKVLIEDFLSRAHAEWRKRSSVQISRLYDLFHREIQGNSMPDVIEGLQKEVKSSSMGWDNKDSVELSRKEWENKSELQRTGMSTFTCFLIVRNELFGKIKEIEAFLNDNCLKSTRKL